MTGSVAVMIIIGIILILASFFVSEKLTKKEDVFNVDLLTVDDNYEFSERELRVIRRKIEDVIAEQAKDILYETNDSLSNMANEKTMALGDYAVAVCDEIEKNHKEVMFLYSMLEDKQKEIMKTVKTVDETSKNLKEMISELKKERRLDETLKEPMPKMSAIDQLTNLTRMKKEAEQLQLTGNVQAAEEVPEETKPAVPDRQAESVKVQEYTEEIEEQETESKDTESEDIFAEMDETELDFEDELEEEFQENENSNDIILEMYKNGNSIIDIAKQLGLGVGEVKLVIDLYRGE
ncbi:MAG: hypothetical protein K2J90_10535 [Lachnospiraceae bacterium]|nr:hypothetical protein [Lachnospiraceae bacterium]